MQQSQAPAQEYLSETVSHFPGNFEKHAYATAEIRKPFLVFELNKGS